MRVVGIDPGSIDTGYALVEIDVAGKKLIEVGRFRAPEKWPKDRRLAEILGDWRKKLDEWDAAGLRPEIGGIEHQFVHSNWATAMTIGETRGMLKGPLLEREIRIYEVNPARAKKIAGGTGRATKENVRLALRTVEGMGDDVPLDASDAVSLAVSAWHESFNERCKENVKAKKQNRKKRSTP